MKTNGNDGENQYEGRGEKVQVASIIALVMSWIKCRSV